MRLILIVAAAALLAACSQTSTHPAAAAAGERQIAWESWSDDIFERAAREGRLVLLDLGAVWCHWCHVMEETTYRDPAVVRLIAKGYIAVKVDQAERPDLAHRYEDYGWPATIIFDASGKELAKLRGYIPPERARALLAAFLDDPTPGPSAIGDSGAVGAGADGLPDELRDELVRIHDGYYDHEHGSWGTVHKYLPVHPMEYCLTRVEDGDVAARARARQTLDGQLALVDPVWGGVYQYSHGGVWTNPHFEKIMAMQADDLRLFTRGAALLGEPRYLAAARSIARYLSDFLTGEEGAFFASQDADLVPGEHAGGYFALDDAERRARGRPRIDRHLFARENGWAIRAFAVLYAATGDEDALARAERAARWVLAHRALPGGGFRHDEHDIAGPYLGDTLALGRAFLELYAVTGHAEWLGHAESGARYIESRFTSPGEPGVVTAAARPGDPLPPRPQRDENVECARFANLLFHYTGDDLYRTLSDRAMSWLAVPAAARRRPTAGILLAARERARAPLEITIVGRRDDPAAARLFQVARQTPTGYKRVVRWHPDEGPHRNAAISYPAAEHPTAFVCVDGACSPPMSTAAELTTALAR